MFFHTVSGPDYQPNAQPLPLVVVRQAHDPELVVRQAHHPELGRRAEGGFQVPGFHLDSDTLKYLGSALLEMLSGFPPV